MSDMMQNNTIEHEKFYVSRGMISYGGSFVRTLGVALANADLVNTRIIKHSFPEYWEKYLDIGKKDYEGLE